VTERPEDEQAAEEAADAAGLDVEDLVDEHEAPVDTPAERAYSIRAAVAGVRRTRRFARISLAVAAVALLVAAGTVAAALTGVIGGDELDTQAIVAEATPSTVRVSANFRGQQADGSGWVLDAGDGLIVTNFHVVSGGTEFDVTSDGDSSDADLVAAAPCEDLALLKADETEGLETLPLGSGADLGQGEPVVALGYPANLSLGEDISSTAGVISVVTAQRRERLRGILATGAVPGTSASENRIEGALISGVDGRRVDPDLQSYCDAVEDLDSGDSAVLQLSPKPGGKIRSATVRFE